MKPRIEVTSRCHVTGVHAGQVSAMKERHTYPNPKFAELKRLGKWTGNTKETICYVQEHGTTYTPPGSPQLYMASLPRGCYAGVMQDLGARAWIRTSEPTLFASAPHLEATLRPYQQRCVDACGDDHQGLIVAPTGSGKTVIALAVIADHSIRTIILVHTKELQRQWVEAVKRFLPDISAGTIGGGRDTCEGADIVIGMVQTLTHRDGEELQAYGMIIVDECHHIPAAQVSGILDRCPAHYRYGLTATPKRRDGAHYLLPLYLGKTLATIERREVETGGSIVGFDVLFLIQNGSTLPDGFKDLADWGKIKQALAADAERNDMIALASEKGIGATLVLTDFTAHAEVLAELTGGVLLHGKLGKKAREDGFAKVRAGASITVATTALIGEGIDVSRWSTLILAMPFSSRGNRLMQAIGRIIRPMEGKDRALVVDISDNHAMLLSAEYGRRRMYKVLGAEVTG